MLTSLITMVSKSESRTDLKSCEAQCQTFLQGPLLTSLSGSSEPGANGRLCKVQHPKADGADMIMSLPTALGE